MNHAWEGESGSQGVWDGRAHTAGCEMDHQQGPAVRHRGLCCVMGRPGWDGASGENMYVHG